MHCLFSSKGGGGSRCSWSWTHSSASARSCIGRWSYEKKIEKIMIWYYMVQFKKLTKVQPPKGSKWTTKHCGKLKPFLKLKKLFMFRNWIEIHNEQYRSQYRIYTESFDTRWYFFISSKLVKNAWHFWMACATMVFFYREIQVGFFFNGIHRKKHTRVFFIVKV